MEIAILELSKSDYRSSINQLFTNVNTWDEVSLEILAGGSWIERFTE